MPNNLPMENKTMTPEEQRITIAEACGWKLFASYDDGPRFYDSPKGYSGGVVLARYPDIEGSHTLPDYLNDLNAMHEAEKVLNADQCAEYVRYLALDHPTFCILPSEESDKAEVRYQYFSLINATAAKRAEAFLKTLNLWKP